VIDPLAGFLSSSIDTHNDSQVRREAMDPIAELGERAGCTILMQRHLRKEGKENTNPLYRGLGSIGMGGAVRACYQMIKPDPTNRLSPDRVLWTVKNNLAPLGEPPPLKIKVTGVEETDSAGETMHIAKLEFDVEGGKTLGYADVFPNAKGGPAGEENRAERFYLEILKPYGTWISKATVQRAADAASLTEPTLRRARQKLTEIGHLIEDNGKRKEAAAWRMLTDRVGGDEAAFLVLMKQSADETK